MTAGLEKLPVLYLGVKLARTQLREAWKEFWFGGWERGGGGAGIVNLYFASACTLALELMGVSHVLV